uniref:Uncharacterized protein n=1 Tax=Graphocephala atropunctata TaxID=36148 RepID=A0A1B6L4C0_9HEMI
MAGHVGLRGSEIDRIIDENGFLLSDSDSDYDDRVEVRNEEQNSDIDGFSNDEMELDFEEPVAANLGLDVEMFELEDPEQLEGLEEGMLSHNECNLLDNE